MRVCVCFMRISFKFVTISLSLCDSHRIEQLEQHILLKTMMTFFANYVALHSKQTDTMTMSIFYMPECKCIYICMHFNIIRLLLTTLPCMAHTFFAHDHTSFFHLSM